MKEERKNMKEERGRERERESVKEGKRKARSTVHIAKFYQFPSEFPANGRVLYFAHKYSAKPFANTGDQVKIVPLPEVSKVKLVNESKAVCKVSL